MPAYLVRTWRMVCQIKMRDKRDKSPSHVPACRFSLHNRRLHHRRLAPKFPLWYGERSVPQGLKADGSWGWMSGLLARTLTGQARWPLGVRVRSGESRRPVSGGVVFSKLSKLLNQEDALGAPCCLRGHFCSPQAPSRGAGMLRTDVIRRFCCHITVLLHPSHHAYKR
jgi:hypothetical protein